jgi:SH3-like domain-containing protein
MLHKFWNRFGRAVALAGLVIAGAWGGPVGAETPQFPAWRSLRDPVVNMRTGPGEDYAIRFIYRRQFLPIKVLRLYQGWYLVEDPDGSRGWMMMRFLNKTPTALIRGKGPVEMRAGPGADAQLLWKLAPGLVGRLGPCKDGWCQMDIDRHVGFVPEGRLWGAGKP